MKTIIKEINVYKFPELPAAIQDHIIENWNNEGDYAFSGEWSESLTEFCSVLSIRLNSYQFGPYTQGFVNWSYDCLEEIEPGDLIGLRLRTWLINNFLSDLEKPRYYFTKNKYRHSKIQFNYDCTLTGVCIDNSLIQPIIDFVDNFDLQNGDDLEDVIRSCFHSFLRDYQKDIENQDSKEYIIDCIEANEWEFLEDGTIYHE